MNIRPNKQPPEDEPEPQVEKVRLNKYLASCGVASRRRCDSMIEEGLVVVNGKVCTDMGTKVSIDDFVKIENKRVLPREHMTILFNKPRGCVCTKNDELDRDTIYEYLPPTLRHLNHVGRLDQDSEGLLVLTNDGELAQTLTHPKLKTEKEYLVTVNQAFDNGTLDQFLKGVYMGPGMGRGKAKAVKRLSPRRFLITLDTGMKRQIRLMAKGLHLQVTKLVRVRIGMVVTSGLEPGRWTELDADDIKMLQTNPKSLQQGHRSKPFAAKGGAAAKNKTRRKSFKGKATPKSSKSYRRKK